MEILPVEIEVYSLYIIFSYKNLGRFFVFFSIRSYHVYKCLEHVQNSCEAPKKGCVITNKVLIDIERRTFILKQNF